MNPVILFLLILNLLNIRQAQQEMLIMLVLVKLVMMQQINFIGKLENQANGATMFFIIEKLEETTFKFSQNSAIII